MQDLDTQKIPVATVGLIVTRDAMTILPTTVPVYEAEVVKALFGRDNVEVLETPTAPVDVDPTAEAARLVKRYGSEELVIKAHGANYESVIERAVAEAATAAQGVGHESDEQPAERPARRRHANA